MISNNLFGYYNLTETLFNQPKQKAYPAHQAHQAHQIQQQKTLLKQYIIDRKCKIAVTDNYYNDYYNDSVRILDNQNIYDLGILEEIYKHYTNEGKKGISHGMFYWITVDNLEEDATEDALE